MNASKHTLVSTKTEIGFVPKPGQSFYEITEFIKGEILKGLVSVYGREPREYELTLHENCSGNGYMFTTLEAWSNDTHCTGCEMHNYYGIGD